MRAIEARPPWRYPLGSNAREKDRSRVHRAHANTAGGAMCHERGMVGGPALRPGPDSRSLTVRRWRPTQEKGLPSPAPFPDGASSNKNVEKSQTIEAELLREVQHKAAAFEDAYNRCRKRRMGMLQECLEGAMRSYQDALRAFSDLILDGRYENKPRLSGGR